MWKCRRCNERVLFALVTPDIDDFGCYFICPSCGRRNALINIGSNERIVLMQPDIDLTMRSDGE